MLPVSHRATGNFFAFPDICLTPPLLPIPYPNTAFKALATLHSPNIFICMAPALFLTTIVPTSVGDEPGVLHYSTKGQCMVVATPITHVLYNFLPACTLTATTTQNLANAAGTDLVPSVVNVFICQRDEAAEDVPVTQHELALGSASIAIAIFSFDLPARFAAAMASLQREAASLGRAIEQLTIDLRGCPGGELSAAIELASDFVRADTSFGTMIDADGDEEPLVSRGGARWSMPLTVLVDGGTASAAELFAEWLRRAGRATIVGGPTYGKHHGAMIAAPPGRVPALQTVRFSFASLSDSSREPTQPESRP